MTKKRFVKHRKDLKELHDTEDKITETFELLLDNGGYPVHFSLEKPITFILEVLDS